MRLSIVLQSVFGLVLALALSTAAHAQGQRKLAVGDAAPGLDIEAWASGSETTLEGGKVYVVEFFTSDSAPSRRAVPTLSDLQRDLGEKGLVIIGVSWEEPGVVRRFVDSQGGKIGYTIAADRREGTKRAWIDAADIKNVPTAFIVDRKGKIAWIGNPVTAPDFGSILKRVMSGRYDPRLEKQAAPGIEGASNARKVKNWRMANKYYDEVVALDGSVFASVALDKFDMLLLDMNDKKAAYEYAQKLIEDPAMFANDGEALQMLAEKIATDPRIDKAHQDMDVALAASEAARKVIGEGDPQALANVALIRFHRGELSQAVDLQKQAYFNAAPKAKPGLKRQLDLYQQAAERQPAGSAPTPQPPSNPKPGG